MTKPQVIFLGNGPLADAVLATLEQSCDIIFHARKSSDLAEVVRLKSKYPAAHAVLASFGVMIKSDVLQAFEKEGIINIHPSLLPKYRGPSPIETAIKNGDTDFGVSVMKLVRAMDAGPLYHQEKITFSPDAEKSEIYQVLGATGAKWLVENFRRLSADNAGPSARDLTDIITPQPQIGEPTFTKMLDKSLSLLVPKAKTASELLNEIRAYAGWPKSKYTLYGLDCAIISAHLISAEELAEITQSTQPTQSAQSTQPTDLITTKSALILKCKDDTFLSIDTLQPAGRKPMDAKSFLNGYAK